MATLTYQQENPEIYIKFGFRGRHVLGNDAMMSSMGTLCELFPPIRADKDEI